MDAIKHDQNKPRLDLVPPEFTLAIGEVLGYGASIYGDRNWESGAGLRWGRVLAACLRHINAWQSGEKLDKESGLCHLSHAACCLAFLIAYQRRGLGENDIFKEMRNENNHGK